MGTKLDKNSYLKFSQLYNIDGVEFFDIPDFPEILPQQDDDYFIVGVQRPRDKGIVSPEEHIRIDKLSQRIYGTPKLWWIIALRNNLELVPSQLQFNQLIIVPSPRYVFQEYLPKAG